VRGLKHKNVAAELLEKLLKDELKVRSKKNLVQSQSFAEKLKKTLNAYHTRGISTMEVIEELIQMAKEMDAATKRGVDLGLTDDEVFHRRHGYRDAQRGEPADRAQPGDHQEASSTGQQQLFGYVGISLLSSCIGVPSTLQKCESSIPYRWRFVCWRSSVVVHPD